MTRRLDPVRNLLLKLADQRSVSLAALSTMIGRNSSYLQQFVRKGSPKVLAERDRLKLAQFFGVHERELGGLQEKSYDSFRLGREPELVEIPRLAVHAAAGGGAFNSEETAFDAFRFSRRWLVEQGLERADLSAITVEGDSMEPLLNHGDEILVDHSLSAFSDGVHVVRLGENVFVKRVASAGAGRFTLLSQNPAYPPIDVMADDLEIVGRVVWKGGRI